MGIHAMIFDLDGTLVKTERLKALSYARAVMELCPYAVREDQVLEAFKQVVGKSRRHVATYLVEHFDLTKAAGERMDEFGVDTAWQSFVQVRLGYYRDMLSDPDVLRKNRWSHNVKLLEKARQWRCKIALATMSHCEQANYILEVLELSQAFDFIATRDDVEQPKPDPEIYQLVSRELEIPPVGCLVIEDSPSGVEAALSAGMWCIAVTTPFTRQHLHEQKRLEEQWIVDDPQELPDVVDKIIAERQP
jgi:beta-phosphoglucomutase